MIETTNIPDNAALLQIIQQQSSQIEEQRILIEELKKQNQLLRDQLSQAIKAIYGSKSESYKPVNGTELPLDLPMVAKGEPVLQTINYQREKSTGQSKHKGRLPLPEHLERVRVAVSPKEDVSGLIKIGEEITEQLECEPGKLYVKQFVREKYAKPQGEGVIIADLPSFIIPRGVAGTGLLALIVIQKFVDHLPLYRQIEQFKRMGMDIPSSTISDWVGMSIKELTPLFEVLKSKILSTNYLQADETPIKVLDRDKKGKAHRGFYWVYRDPQSGLVLFDYQPGRGSEGPTEILKNFEGYLQTDGYSVYEKFDKGKITLIHCMAHARRKFEKALNENKVLADHFLREIQKVYAVERTAKENNFSYDQRKEIRHKESVPILEDLHHWMKINIVKTTPESLSGKALAYTLPRWDKLMLYTKDGKLEIDNNLVENSIRPIAIGRKNYLFAGSHESAQRAAMIYSLLGTCKLKGIEPFQWLKNVFEILPDWKFNRLEELLP